MNKYLPYILVLSLFYITSCQQGPEKTPEITWDEAVKLNKHSLDTNLYYLDSLQVLNFISLHPEFKKDQSNLELFYKKRKGAFAWITREGPNEFAGNFINLINRQERNKKNDSLYYQDQLHVLFSLINEESFNTDSSRQVASELEMMLTSVFFDYARWNWGGMDDDELKEVNWYIDRKKINYEDLLDSTLKYGTTYFFSHEPVNRQYGLLKQFLSKYNDIELTGGWDTLPRQLTEMMKGDTSSGLISLKKHLYQLNDLEVADSSILFTGELEDALKIFQKRHGIKEDGRISEKTWSALNVPVHTRIQQLLINLERSKWVPVEQPGDYLVINIPDFKLYVFENDSLKWNCRVIVGKSKISNNTVIFNDNLEYIVFSPYWNIPKSILIKETLPEIKRKPNYLTTHQMEIVTNEGVPVNASAINWKNYTTNFPYIIRQKPGKNNALGLVKFLFPNAYDIYMHDTPEKSLFGENTRTFSHGCIRIEEPEKLAQFLLRNDSAFTKNNISMAMHSGKQKFVKLKNQVPVFIVYFTAWVDRSGKLQFRDDIYHHDEKMKTILLKDL